MATPCAGMELCDSTTALERFVERVRGWEKDFWAQRFDILDAQFNELLQSQGREGASDAEIATAFGTFRNARPGNEPLHLEWVRRFPRSQAALLALGYHYTQRWEVSGRVEDLAAANDAFKYARRFSDQASIANAMLVRLARASKIEPASMYRARLAQFPRSVELRVQYIHASSPRRGGSIKQLTGVSDDLAKLPLADQRYVRHLIYREVAMAYEDAEDYKRAAQAYERSAPMCPGMQEARLQLAEVYARLNRFREMVPVLDRVVAVQPRNGRAFAARGLAHRHTGNLQQAFADYDRAAELAYGPAFHDLAWFFETGTVVPRDPAKALDLYRLAASHGVATAKQKVQALQGGAKPR